MELSTKYMCSQSTISKIMVRQILISTLIGPISSQGTIISLSLKLSAIMIMHSGFVEPTSSVSLFINSMSQTYHPRVFQEHIFTGYK